MADITVFYRVYCIFVSKLRTLKLGFPTQVDFTCVQLRALARAIPSDFLAFVFQFFDNIQLKSYGMQYMQLIIAQFLSTTKTSI